MTLNQDDKEFFKLIHYTPLKKEHWRAGLTPYRAGARRDEYKNRIKVYLEAEQNNCCAYCGISLETFGDSHRDHIAPASIYPQFLFRPDNLILACPRCNGLNKKKDANTISNLGSGRYRHCIFNVVHPYFDNPAEHIRYIADSTGILIQSTTVKGRNTVDLFELDSVHFTETRAQCINSNFHPLDAECTRLRDEFIRSRQAI